MAPRVALPLAAILGAIVGFGAGIRFATPPAPSPPVDAAVEPTASPAAAPLEQALERERQARDALELEVARLRERVPEPEVPAAETEPPAGEAPDADIFDRDSLVQAGIPPHEVARLQARFEAFELELLYLQDEARRAQWKPPRLQSEQSNARQEMRNEVGDDDYDAMLYAAGRKNRVIILDVLANSAAETGGLRKGDAILQYGDERIFDMNSLVSATREGERGALTEIRYERGGDVRRIFVPRGPIGVRLGRERRLPDSFR
jgi:hypothetical protein